MTAIRCLGDCGNPFRVRTSRPGRGVRYTDLEDDDPLVGTGLALSGDGKEEILRVAKEITKRKS